MNQSLRKKITVGNLSMSYLELGSAEGTPLLLLHGFPEDSGNWQEVGEYLASLGLRVLIPDQRGFARTAGPSDIKSCRFDLLAQDMVGFLDALNLKKVFLVGHDWGGAISWYLISKYPKRFQRAVIANAPHWRVFRKFMLTSPLQILKSWYMILIQLPFLPEWFLSRFGYGLFSLLIKRSSINQVYPDALLSESRSFWSSKMTGMLNWYRAIILFRDFAKRPLISVPVTVVWGRKEPFLSLALAYESAAECSKGEVIVLDQVGHWPHYEDLESFKKILNQFK